LVVLLLFIFNSCVLGTTIINCNPAPAYNPSPSVQSGTSTWFDAYAQGGGACGWTPDMNDLYVAAYSAPTVPEMCVQCGNCFNVTGPKGSVVVRVIDYCDTTKGSCPTGVWTLDQNPYVVISGSTGTGSVAVTYFGPVPCPVTKNLEYTLQSGVSEWWISINVQNERYPLSSVEIQHNGNWTLLPRASYNYWWYNPTGTPQDFPTNIRVNDTKGDSETDTVTSLSEGTWYGKSNFGGGFSENSSGSSSRIQSFFQLF